MCRECLRVEEWPEVEVKKVADHFIFSIESSGCLPPEVIFREVSVWGIGGIGGV